MAYVTRRPSGKYQVRWTDPDRRERARTFPTRRQANQFKVEVEACIAAGRRWLPEEAGDAPAVEELITRYLEHRRHRLRLTTVRRYQENLDLFWRFLRHRRPSGHILANTLTRPCWRTSTCG